MKIYVVALISFLAIDSFAGLTVRVTDLRTNRVKQIDHSEIYLGIDTNKNLLIKGFSTREEDAVIITDEIAKASNYPSLTSMAGLIQKLKNQNNKLYALECYEIQGSKNIDYCNLREASF